MALQGEARKLYHRDTCAAAGMAAHAGVRGDGAVCSECVLPPSPERIVISLGSGYRL